MDVRVLRSRRADLRLDHTVFMGILNVTPDSFSDGGTYFDPPLAVEHGLRLADEGAQILDVGGESTRPGAEPVSAHEEWRRVGPVLRDLRAKTDAWISVDTYKPEVAAKAISLGVDMVNDVTGLRDDQMIRLAAREKVAAVVMHMVGEPRTMQRTATYRDVVSEILEFLQERTQEALAAGVGREAIVVDPGLGFGKRPEHNTEIIREMGRFRVLGFPILVGPSRKSFVRAKDDNSPGSPEKAGISAARLAVRNGADIVRVHDVATTAKAIRAAGAVPRDGP